MEFPVPTITQRPFNHFTPLPVEVSGTNPRPDQLYPSSEIAIVFPPEPTATNFGLLNVVTGVNPIPNPLVVKVVAPFPVHTIPSAEVAYVFPPWPIAVHREPFQNTFCPAVVKTVAPNPTHVVPFVE